MLPKTHHSATFGREGRPDERGDYYMEQCWLIFKTETNTEVEEKSDDPPTDSIRLYKFQ